MKSSKNILQYSLFLIVLLILFVFRIHTFSSLYTKEETILKGILCTYQIVGNQLKAEVSAKEKILLNYYFTSEDEKNDFIKNYHFGDTIQIKGELTFPSSNRNFYLFDYQKYLKSKKIFWIMKGDSIVKISSHKPFWFFWKEFLYRTIEKKKNASYLKYLLLGDSSQVETTFKEDAQMLGISHLFAISGMHIHLFVGMLLWILKRITKGQWIQFACLGLFLTFYSFLTNFSPSVLRASLFFLCLLLKKIVSVKISSLFLLCGIGIGMLFYNPYYIYHLGFIFSFLISFSLLFFSRYQKKTTYMKQLFQTSWIAFWMGVPLLIRNFFQVNFLTPFWNLFFVPFVSLILFPTCILCLLFPFLNPIFDGLLWILGCTMELGKRFTLLQIPFSYIPIPLFLFYLLVIFWSLKKWLQKCYKPFLLVIILLFVHYHSAVWNPYYKMTIIDVGQGDSILLTLPYQQGNLLIDTGGILHYEKEEWKKRNPYSIGKSVLIPYLQSVGIHRLDYLILTHGDVDHMQEASVLIDHFPIQNIIMNAGSQNALESAIYQKALSKKIPVFFLSQGQIEIANHKFYFLNTKNEKNENEDSLILYTKLNQRNILLMGDAGEESEQLLVQNYQLPRIDVLKVGHHGSKNGTSKIFLDAMMPKYALISAGVGNRFGHPHEEVIDRLYAVNSQIYSTSEYGMIEIILRDNLKINTRYLAR